MFLRETDPDDDDQNCFFLKIWKTDDHDDQQEMEQFFSTDGKQMIMMILKISLLYCENQEERKTVFPTDGKQIVGISR